MKGIFALILCLFCVSSTAAIATQVESSQANCTEPNSFYCTEAPTFATEASTLLVTEPTMIPTLPTLPTESTKAPTEPTKPTKPTQPVQDLISLGQFKLTAYCPCEECSGPWGTLTSTGTQAKPKHTVAVDPSVIPYGTKLYINGETYCAEDCGALVKGNVIDVYFETHEEVDEFYNKTVQVFAICEDN